MISRKMLELKVSSRGRNSRSFAAGIVLTFGISTFGFAGVLATQANEEAPAQLAEAEKMLHWNAVECSHGSHLCRIKLSVTNMSDIPLTVDATGAELRNDHGVVELAKTSEQMLSRKNKASLSSFLTAAVSVGTVQTIQEINEQKGDVLKRYESDEQKRAIEEEMFGKTLVYPGTSNSGYIYFSESSVNGTSFVRCPVETFYEPKSVIYADVQIEPKMIAAPALKE